MSPARIIILIVALAAGIGAAMLMQRPSAPEKVQHVAAPTVPVLVAATDIPVGHLVTAADMRWIDWPLSSVPAGVLRKDETPEAETELAGQLARFAMLVSEPLRREKLIKADSSGFLSAVLPSGMRAIAITTDGRGANTAGGFILPNDRVDVIATLKDAASQGGDYISETILQNLRVLAIGQNVQERNGEKVVIGETATLEVEPAQVEKLVQAQRDGSLSLALRSLRDANEKPDTQTERALTLVKYGITTKSVK